MRDTPPRAWNVAAVPTRRVHGLFVRGKQQQKNSIEFGLGGGGGLIYSILVPPCLGAGGLRRQVLGGEFDAYWWSDPSGGGYGGVAEDGVPGMTGGPGLDRLESTSARAEAGGRREERSESGELHRSRAMAHPDEPGEGAAVPWKKGLRRMVDAGSPSVGSGCLV